jgi:Protein of unknown function (DUF3455)
MKRSELALLMMFGGAGMALVATSGCSSDDSGTSGSGGSGGQAGGSGGKAATEGGSGGTATAGHGGVSGGGSVAGGSGLSGAGGSAGASGGLGGGGGALAEGGAAGGMSDAGAGGEGPTTPCGPSSLTKPTVPTDIQVADSAVLVAAYAAEGTQTYTCQVTGAGDAATYAWSTASTPSANLYGSDCTIAVTHYAGPHWKANDGSIILGTKVRSVASSTAASIVQLLLSAVVDGGSTGILTPVTAVQRLNTVGGIAPSTGCDAAHVNGTVAVPYTATYYFYSGSNIIP